MSDLVSASDWFAPGQRLRFDRESRAIASDGGDEENDVRFWTRTIGGETPKVVSILPGWPDGSYGFSAVEAALTDAPHPRLYFDYIGHGDSDKPLDYPYSTFERADLVESLWAYKGIKETDIVAFDYSVIVTLELLSRLLERRERGESETTTIQTIVLANGGLFADGHSHSWYTTPILKSAIGGAFSWLGQKSRSSFLMFFKKVFSKGKVPSKAELAEIYEAMSRRGGIRALAKTAEFVVEHEKNSDRLDFARLYRALAEEIDFRLVWSPDDEFEGGQLELAKECLGSDALDVHTIEGGHLSTSEHPETLAAHILAAISD